MREYLYYLRPQVEEGSGPPLVTVALLETKENVFARGIAVCSPLDFPCKSVGRAKAMGLAIRAIETKESGGRIIREEAVQVLTKVNAPQQFTHRWNYDAVLTPFEAKLIDSEGGPL
jgi:hypothetical protein